MGGFLLYPESIDLSRKEVDQLFGHMGLVPGKVFSNGRFNILLYKKSLAENESYLESGKDYIICVGTFFYRKQSQNDSLKIFLKDFKNNQIFNDEIIGQFSLILVIDNQINLILDRLAIQNVYFDARNKIMSSSLLAVCTAHPGKLDLNRNSIVEILLTGGLVGPDTVFNEVKRVEPIDNIIFEGIKVINLPEVNYTLKERSRDKLITNQLDTLDHYFSLISKPVSENKVILGLTGGYDSRLLMCFAERHFTNTSYYTHWRKGENKEIELVKILAKKIQKELHQYVVKYPEDMTREEALDTLQQSFYHNDGHIRTQIYWHEYYNTLDYARSIFGTGFLALNGIGGELYRNFEKMVLPEWNFESWLKYEILYRNSANLFNDKKTENEFIAYFSSKILDRLRVDQPRFIDRLFLKRYHNEVYNVSNRCVRSVMENKLINSLSPFVEPLVSFKAYEAIPALGNSMSFQSDMIKMINPELAKVNSNYGYDFFTGESFLSVIQNYLFEMLPKKYFFKMYNAIRKNYNDDFYDRYKYRFDFMTGFEDHIMDLNLPVDIKRLKSIKHTGWLLISLGFFLMELENKINK